MNILLLGNGGREHALAYKLAQSSKLKKLFIAPGNPGTEEYGENIEINISDFKIISSFALENAIDMIVVGPEAPLVDGIVDFFEVNEKLKHIKIIGPCSKGAALEGSKDFAKAFMTKYNIPTAKYATFSEFELNKGYTFLEKLKPPYVLKADGLASGKGVLILNDLVAAKSMLHEMLRGKFGKASRKVVIEEYLDGIEVSVFVLTDGKTFKLLPEAKDYKRVGECDTGLNTGGMGAISPVPFADGEFLQKVCDKIVKPTIDGLQKEGITYKGFLFVGLMNQNGEPAVIEYNVRLGDPESEVILPRLNADLIDLFEGTVNGCLDQYQCNISPDIAVTVVCTSGGYPDDYNQGYEIKGLNTIKNALIFHAGTKKQNGHIVTSGGRVMAVTALGDSILIARDKVYNAVSCISFKDMYYRKDIGNDLISKYLI